MMAISEFPRCSAYLKAMHFKLNDPSMTDYGWAVALSENWTDAFLVKDGRVNFDTMDGASILTEFERLLRDGGGRQKSRGISHEDMERLKAFLGSRGIKTSMLKGMDDYWSVAEILWPHKVSPKQDADLSSLLSTLSGMTKKQRQTARDNLHKVPAQFRGASA
jgi:hypothetical protein